LNRGPDRGSSIEHNTVIFPCAKAGIRSPILQC